MYNIHDTRQNYKWYNNQIEKYTNRIQNLESNIEIHQSLILSLVQSKFTDLPSGSTSTSPSRQFESIIHENISLSKALKTSYQDLNINQSKAFLSEQILNDVCQRLNEISEEYAEKMNEYTFSDDTKKKVIIELGEYNRKLVETVEGFIKSKSLEIVPLREDILDLYKNTECMKEKIQELARMCFIAGEYREILSEYFKKVTMGQQKVQALLKNPINRRTGAERVQFTQFQETIEESSDTSQSSEVELSDINRTVTVPKQSSVVPKIDFSKITKSKSLLTHQDLPKASQEASHHLKELKSIYKSLNSSITEQSEKLEQLSRENFKLQQQNVKLVNELLSFAPSSENGENKEIEGLDAISEEYEFN